MDHRTRVDVRGEIVVGLADEEPVRDIEERGTESADGVENLGGCRDRRVDGRCHEKRDEGGRKQAPIPACVEARQANVPVVEKVPSQQLGDEIAGQDEEDVYADEPAVQAMTARVKRDDEIDRDGSEPVEIWPILPDVPHLGWRPEITRHRHSHRTDRTRHGRRRLKTGAGKTARSALCHESRMSDSNRRPADYKSAALAN